MTKKDQKGKKPETKVEVKDLPPQGKDVKGGGIVDIVKAL